MPHEPEQSQGSFPVRFDDGIWEVLNASYVTVLTPPGGERAVGTERAGLAQPSHDERPEARAGSW
ncbi:MAG: hypothetical protein ACRDRR_24610 [Pseudonocardiaceae bacterium]